MTFDADKIRFRKTYDRFNEGQVVSVGWDAEIDPHVAKKLCDAPSVDDGEPFAERVGVDKATDNGGVTDVEKGAPDAE